MPEKRKGGIVCAAKNCKNISMKCKASFFRFPKDANRAHIWVMNCGRPDLLQLPSETLYKSHRVCSAHFEERVFLNDLKNRLHTHAVPTLFKAEGSSQAYGHSYGCSTARASQRLTEESPPPGGKNTSEDSNTDADDARLTERLKLNENFSGAKNTVRRGQWFKKLKLCMDTFTKCELRICSKHFGKECFFLAENFQRLKPEAIPHLLLDAEDNQEPLQTETANENQQLDETVSEDSSISTSISKLSEGLNQPSTSADFQEPSTSAVTPPRGRMTFFQIFIQIIKLHLTTKLKTNHRNYKKYAYLNL